MSTYEGTAVKDKAVIRKSSATGMKIGALKIGAPILGDKVEDGSDGKKWMHISKPMDGWVLTEDINYIDPEAALSSSADTPAPNSSTPTTSQPTPGTPSTETSTTSGNLYKVKIWGDPVMIAQGFDYNFVNTSNFQAVPLFIEDGSCGAVTSFLHIPREDIEKLKGLQVPDNFNVKQKMSWLCSYRGEIYMYDNKDDNWEGSPIIRWGSIALGGNLVMVEDIVDMFVKPPDNNKRKMKMAKLAAFRKTDWGKTWQTHPHLVHRAYCVYKNNQFGDSPKGIVYSPLFSPLDWDFAGIVQPQAWYIPLEWLEKQEA